MICQRWIVATLVAGVCLTAVGCGGDSSPPRYRLAGTVSYNGEPVPGGEIMFAPDDSQQNKGPGSVAMIQDGRFETFVDRGIVGGAYRVTIIGYNHVPGSVPDDQLHEIFPMWQTQVELPKKSAEFDFEVPAAPR